MRSVPFSGYGGNTTAATATGGDTASSNFESSVVDLSEELNIKPIEPAKASFQPADNATNTDASDTETETEETKTEPAQEPSATFEGEQPKGYEGFKTEIGKKLKDWAIKPEKLSSFLVKLGNGARVFFLPSVYEWMMFPRADQEDLKKALEKRKEAEKASKEPELNNYEKRLIKDFDTLREAQLNISYTPEEIDELAKLIAKRIADMDVPAWLEKYEWAIFILYLEWTHADKIIYTRAGNAMKKKFGLSNN